MPSIDVVLRGFSLNLSEGNFAPCAVYLIRGHDRQGKDCNIIYDFGHAGRRTKLAASLSRRGLLADEVTTVVLSHAHWDHIQNIDMFCNAHAYVHEVELKYVAAPHPSDHATPIWSKALLDTVTVNSTGDGHEIIPGVKVIDLPGHSVGSIGLSVDTDEGTAIVSGDALATASEAIAKRCPYVFWDPEQADASVRRALELGDIFYPGHDRPFRMNADGVVEYLTAARPIKMWFGNLAATEIELLQIDRTGRHLSGRAAEMAELDGKQTRN